LEDKEYMVSISIKECGLKKKGESWIFNIENLGKERRVDCCGMK
jgi:hypothetical protein